MVIPDDGQGYDDQQEYYNKFGTEYLTKVKAMMAENVKTHAAQDKLTLQLIEDFHISYEDARAIAKERLWQMGVKRYGFEQMLTWSKG